jgi:hypothetical protein
MVAMVEQVLFHLLQVLQSNMLEGALEVQVQPLLQAQADWVAEAVEEMAVQVQVAPEQMV